ncbi:hypothetical protein JCM21900_001812 [Sporobolomyces salmonicolor]
MARKRTSASPSVARRPSTPPESSAVLQLRMAVVSLLPFLFPGIETDLLHPLFSSASTHALAAWLPLFVVLAVVFAVLLRATDHRRPGWRLYWFAMGVWKILSEGLVRWGGAMLLGLGLTKGLLVGRLLLEAVPTLALWSWLWDELSCPEKALFPPSWFLPLAYVGSLVLHTKGYSLATFNLLPECSILQTQGLALVAISLFAARAYTPRPPRSRNTSPAQLQHFDSCALRLSIFVGVLALAQLVAQSSTHCPTSPRALPSPTSSSHVLAAKKSTTGWVVVGEQSVPGPNGAEGYRFRFLRADHSLLGGLWTGVSELELKKKRWGRVTEEEIVQRAESIYSTFILQEIIRLVKAPADLARQSPEQGLIIGLGAGLSARALHAHGVNLTICEIDPAVYEYARTYFGVPEPTGEVVLKDARAWLEQSAAGKQFDYIIHDVFTGGAVPASLFTQEFWSTLRRRLHPSGVLAVNFAGALSSPASKLVLSTLLASFPHCRAFEDDPLSSSAARAADPGLGDDTLFKNMVVFCTPSWFMPVEFRAPARSDWLEYPSPQLRKRVFERYREQEIDLARFRLPAQGEDGGDSEWATKQRGEWLLRDENAKRLEDEQLEGTRAHWVGMAEVLPPETWATW